MRPVLLLAVALVACHAAVDASADRRPAPPVSPAPAVPAGEWTLMRFLGGPPAPGQITDTLHLDPAATRRHVRVERSRAGVSPDRVCELDASEDGAWSELLAALADGDLQDALAHPDRMPGLVLDAGYFACTHAGTRIAISDARNPANAPRETAALARLDSAYERVLAEVTAQPACASLR